MIQSVDQQCLHVLSQFLDELDDFAPSCSNEQEGMMRTRKRSVLSAVSQDPLKHWLGAGMDAAEDSARRSEEVGDDNEEPLELFLEESEGDALLVKRCLALRHETLTEVCAALIRQVHHVRNPAPGAESFREWNHVLMRLVSSQSTRERWIYPLRRVLAQGPVLVAHHILSVLHGALSTDIAGDAFEQLGQMEAFVDNATSEVVFSPSQVIKKCFPLFEALVECTFCVARARLTLLVNARLHFNGRLRPLIDDTDGDEYPKNVQTKSLIEDACDVTKALKKRLALLFQTAGAGSEVHWVFLCSVVHRLMVTSHASSVPCSPEPTSTSEILWKEVLLALQRWLTPSPSLHLSTLTQLAMLSAVHTDVLMDRERFRFLYHDARRMHLRRFEDALCSQGPELMYRLLHVDRLAHLSLLPLHLRFSRNSDAELLHHQKRQCIWNELLRQIQTFIMPRHRTPTMPAWLPPECEGRVRTCLDRIGWSSRVFGDTPEFHALHANRGRMTAERLIATHAFITSTPLHMEIFGELLPQIPMLRKFLCSLAIRTPTVSAQLDDAANNHFFASIIPLLLGDAAITAASGGLFDMDAFDVLREFLTNTIPLTWDFDCVRRVKGFVEENIVVMSEEDSSTSRTKKRVQQLRAIVSVVFVTIAQFVAEQLISYRSAFESRDSNERYDGAMCFSSEDAAIFEAHVATMHQLIGIELNLTSKRIEGSHSLTPMNDAMDEQPINACTLGASPPIPQFMDPPALPSEKNINSAWYTSDDYGEWSVATVAPPSSAPAHQPAAGPKSAFDPPPSLPGPTPQPQPHHDVRPPQQIQLADEMFCVGFDASLMPLYIPWLEFVVRDLLVPPGAGDEAAPILSSDASMHFTLGQGVAALIATLVRRKHWSIGTLQTLCAILRSLCPEEQTIHPSSLQQEAKHAAAYSRGNVVIPVNRVMRMGLSKFLFRGSLQLSRVQLGTEALNIGSRGFCSSIPVAAAEAIGSERTKLVSEFLASWSAFCNWCAE
jgi:hypothetical protein